MQIEQQFVSNFKQNRVQGSTSTSNQISQLFQQNLTLVILWNFDFLDPVINIFLKFSVVIRPPTYSPSTVLICW